MLIPHLSNSKKRSNEQKKLTFCHIWLQQTLNRSTGFLLVTNAASCTNYLRIAVRSNLLTTGHFRDYATSQTSLW